MLDVRIAQVRVGSLGIYGEELGYDWYYAGNVVGRDLDDLHLAFGVEHFLWLRSSIALKQADKPAGHLLLIRVRT